MGVNAQSPRLNVVGIWIALAVLGLLLLFSLMLAGADWLGAGVILGGLVFLVLILRDVRLLAVIWLVGSPTIFVFPNNFLAALPFATVERLLFAALFGVMILARVFNRRPSVPFSFVEKTMLLFLVVLALSLASTLLDKTLPMVRMDVALFVQGYAMPMLSFFIARRLEWSERTLALILKLLVVAGVFLAIVGLLQHFLGFRLFVPTYMEVIHKGRITGTFASALEFGCVMSGFIVLTLLLFVRARDALQRSMLLAAAAVMLASLAFALTRAPIVALMIALGVLVIKDRRIRPLLLAGLVTGSALIIVAFIFVFDPSEFVRRATDMSPIYNRLALFATTVNMFVHNPILGVGFGRYGFADAKAAYITDFGPISAQWAADAGIPHFEYLHIAVLTGAFGGMLYLLVLYGSYRSLGDLITRPGVSSFKRDCALYIRAVFLVYLLNGLTADIGFFNYFGILVFFLIGILTVLREDADPAPRGAHHDARA